MGLFSIETKCRRHINDSNRYSQGGAWQLPAPKAKINRGGRLAKWFFAAEGACKPAIEKSRRINGTFCLFSDQPPRGRFQQHPMQKAAAFQMKCGGFLRLFLFFCNGEPNLGAVIRRRPITVKIDFNIGRAGIFISGSRQPLR